MAANQETPGNGKNPRGPLIACFVLFTLYFTNVVLGKVNILYGMHLPHLGNVAEFLLLFVSCASLIVAALKREAAEKQP